MFFSPRLFEKETENTFLQRLIIDPRDRAVIMIRDVRAYYIAGSTVNGPSIVPMSVAATSIHILAPTRAMIHAHESE